MEYRRFADTIVLRLERGEEIVTQLTRLAEQEQITLAEISGLGAVNELEVCVYDLAEQKYYENSFHEPLEMLSLVGSITEQNGKPYLHLHLTAGDGKGRAVGGHLKRAVISATGEIFVRLVEGHVGRRHDEKTGLNLLDV